MEVDIYRCSFCNGKGNLAFHKLTGDVPPIIMVKCPNCKGRGRVLIQIMGGHYGY